MRRTRSSGGRAGRRARPRPASIIAQGLTGKERVVATAGGFLRDGETVKVAPAPRPPPASEARALMKNISAWAIRHPVSPVVLFVVLLFMGIVAFIRLPRHPEPRRRLPGGAWCRCSQPGAAPQEIETQIMQKVEGAVAGVGNIDNITSLAIEGQSRIFIEFQIGTPIDRAVADVRDAVAKVRVDLPQGIQEPTVTPHRRRRRRRSPTTRSARTRADRRGAVLVRRQHRHQAPAGRRGRRAGVPQRRRQPRDPRRARSGTHAGARHHRRRR